MESKYATRMWESRHSKLKQAIKKNSMQLHAIKYVGTGDNHHFYVCMCVCVEVHTYKCVCLCNGN